MLLFGQREQVPRREPTRETRGTETAGGGGPHRTAARQPARAPPRRLLHAGSGGMGARPQGHTWSRCTHAQAGDGGSGAGKCNVGECHTHSKYQLLRAAASTSPSIPRGFPRLLLQQTRTQTHTDALSHAWVRTQGCTQARQSAAPTEGAHHLHARFGTERSVQCEKSQGQQQGQQQGGQQQGQQQGQGLPRRFSTSTKTSTQTSTQTSTRTLPPSATANWQLWQLLHSKTRARG